MRTANAYTLACLLIAGCVSTGQGPEDDSIRFRVVGANEQPKVLALAGAASWTGSSIATTRECEAEDHDHRPEDYLELLGTDLTRSWFDAWPHNHFSKRGTPFVHLFNLEPAFLDRDLFLNYRSVEGFGEDETELEIELEWALTRRIGLVVEAPYVQLDPDSGSSDSGVGDFAIAPRFLLVEAETFLLSANLEVAIPSGNEHKGLGTGEVGLAPSFSAWFDLGHWVQVNAQAGTEHGLESGDAEVFYNGALVYSFRTPSLLDTPGHDHDHAGQLSTSGVTSTILELTGRTVLDGEDDGRSTAELLFGLSYNVTRNWEMRGGYQIPVGGHEDIDRAVLLSLIFHF